MVLFIYLFIYLFSDELPFEAHRYEMSVRE